MKESQIKSYIKNSEVPIPDSETKGSRYTPLSRADKPNEFIGLKKHSRNADSNL